MKWLVAAIGTLGLWVTVVTLGAPLEAVQGWSQKIFYFHVPSALAMYVLFVLATVAAVVGWREKSPIKSDQLDLQSVAFLDCGLMCCLSVLLTGPIWAKPIWGVWWTWDARLTTTLLMGLIFLSARFSRWSFSDERKARGVYVLLLLIGCLNIPLVRYSVRLFRGVHPTVVQAEDGLTETMKLFFLLSLLFQAVFLWFAFQLRRRRGSNVP